ncbi:MAG TPA: SAM-dependent methyltransferase [Actinomycetota bacterium]|nr:SAM-dependent methyltransferase [Actinomycetota bacterium]
MKPGHDGLGELVRERAARGPISFSDYMELALYHPDLGYYTRAPRSGWEGHYVTSPQLDPAFGELWARGFRLMWELWDRPRRFEVIEIGAGEGGFAAAVLRATPEEFAAALRYVIVEPIAALRTRQRQHLEGAPIEWVENLGDLSPIEIGCLFANEVLDNVPVDLVRRTRSDLVEVRVEADHTGLTFTEVPLSGALRKSYARLQRSLPPGHTTEARSRDAQLIKDAVAALQAGALIFVDYGHEERDLLSLPNGTLMCYSEAGVDDRPLERPGTKDITAHVNWTALRRACKRQGLHVEGPLEQQRVLTALGLDTLLMAARASRETAVAAGEGLSAVRALSRHQALTALADPGGLGRLDVFAAFKGVAVPPFLAGE